MAMIEVEEFLNERARAGLLRNLKPAERRGEGRIFFNGKKYIDFSSNDYLGLSSHPGLIKIIKNALDKFGTASSASRLMSGDLELHHQLEEKVSRFKNKEAALLFNSGYQANIGIISALYGRRDAIFSDRLNHASIVDGIILSRATFFRFPHNDIAGLESLLKEERHKFKQALIITETIFSMDGDRPLLKELVRLKEKYNCQIMVDEAHSTGIFGKNGSGVVEEEGLAEKIDFIMGTFGKALAGFGAYLAASNSAVEYLINTCRSFIYSTALPPEVVAGNLAGIELVENEPERRRRLLNCAEYFRQELKKRGFEIKGVSQIVPLVLGENLKTMEFAKKLQEKGYWVLAVRPPTVPAGQARLRFSLSYNHTKEILKRLIDDISKIRI